MFIMVLLVLSKFCNSYRFASQTALSSTNNKYSHRGSEYVSHSVLLRLKSSSSSSSSSSSPPPSSSSSSSSPSSSSLSSAAASGHTLAKIGKLKVNELKELYKNVSGGKVVSQLRKTELIEKIKALLEDKWKTQQNDDLLDIGSKEESGRGQRSSGDDNATRRLQPLQRVTSSDFRKVNIKVSDSSNNYNIFERSLESSSGNVSYNSSTPYFLKTASTHPYGSARDSRIEYTGGTANMDISFLGTASCIPTITRGVSCIAFRYESDMWLFDCGEASQVQIQKSRVRASKIKKIFLSHTHGDHSFGLPGVLCLLGQSTQDERGKLEDGVKADPIEIYGPQGTRDLVRSMVQLTYSRVVAPYIVHELKNVPYLHKNYVKWIPPPPVVKTRFDHNFGELNGSRDIFPEEDGTYVLFDEGELSVRAAPMQHTIPCVGYVVTEKNRVGKLKVELIRDIVDRNKEEIKATERLNDHYKIFAKLKLLKKDETYTFPDGTIVRGEDIVEPAKPGRKIVIMGDTCNGEHIAKLSMGADLLVHEATNSWIKEFDIQKYAQYDHLEKDTRYHGHSTPQMAAAFATKIGAKQLVLTHFSPRYKGDDSEQSMRVMWRIEDLARASGGFKGKNDVICAWDQMMIPIGKFSSESSD